MHDKKRLEDKRSMEKKRRERKNNTKNNLRKIIKGVREVRGKKGGNPYISLNSL